MVSELKNELKKTDFMFKIHSERDNPHFVCLSAWQNFELSAKLVQVNSIGQYLLYSNITQATTVRLCEQVDLVELTPTKIKYLAIS